MGRYRSALMAATWTRTFHDWFMDQGMSQAGAAVRFDTTQQTIGRWLTGQSVPRASEAGRIAQVMRLDPSTVLEAIAAGKEPMEAPASPGKVKRPDRLDSVLTELAAVPTGGRMGVPPGRGAVAEATGVGSDPSGGRPLA